MYIFVWKKIIWNSHIFLAIYYMFVLYNIVFNTIFIFIFAVTQFRGLCGKQTNHWDWLSCATWPSCLAEPLALSSCFRCWVTKSPTLSKKWKNSGNTGFRLRLWWLSKPVSEKQNIGPFSYGEFAWWLLISFVVFHPYTLPSTPPPPPMWFIFTGSMYR